MIGLAALEGRIILTSDRTLASRCSARGLKAVLVTGKRDSDRVDIIARATSQWGVRLVAGDPLCSLCGGGLESLGRNQIAGQVPPTVERRHRLFFRCASCGHLYWRGSHWKKLRSLSRRLE